jgi:hypothetical protein
MESLKYNILISKQLFFCGSDSGFSNDLKAGIDIIQPNDVGLALLRQLKEIFPAGKQKKLAAVGFSF